MCCSSLVGGLFVTSTVETPRKGSADIPARQMARPRRAELSPVLDGVGARPGGRRIAESLRVGTLPSQRASDVHGDPHPVEGAPMRHSTRAADYGGKAYASPSATLRSAGL